MTCTIEKNSAGNEILRGCNWKHEMRNDGSAVRSLVATLEASTLSPSKLSGFGSLGKIFASAGSVPGTNDASNCLTGVDISTSVPLRFD